MASIGPLLSFLEAGKTAYHAIAQVESLLQAEGYTLLEEISSWTLMPGGKYYTQRNGSSLIAFQLPLEDFSGFQIVASHSDSPTFKIKEKPELKGAGHYTKINVEAYGGMLCSPWFDRPLSVAGRVVVRTSRGVESRLVDVDRDLLLIPSLAIHMNRKANEGVPLNVQKDVLPLIGTEESTGALMRAVAESARTEEKDILGKDLFLYVREKSSIWGDQDIFFSAPRIDNLECAYTTLQGFMKAEKVTQPAVYCVFDNEEVGSATKQGAASTFLYDVLSRIAEGLGNRPLLPLLAGSFMVSADNAHGVHPNYPEKTDEENRVFMNGGIVVKHSANQKYTTDGISRGIFCCVMEKAGIPVQDFVNRSDVLGGSTLGSISNTRVSVPTIDIGLAQLAMHSPYETAGTEDPAHMEAGMKAFFESCIRADGEGRYILA